MQRNNQPLWRLFDSLRGKIDPSQMFIEVIRMANFIQDQQAKGIKSFDNKEADKVFKDPKINMEWGIDQFCKLDKAQQEELYDVLAGNKQDLKDLIISFAENHGTFERGMLLPKDVIDEFINNLDSYKKISIIHGDATLKAYKEILKIKSKSITLYIYPYAEALAKFIFKNSQINVTTRSIWDDLNELLQNDKILIMGPLGHKARNSQAERFYQDLNLPPSTSTVETLIAKFLLDCRNDISVSALVPSGVLFSSSSKKFREIIRDWSTLKSIIELQTGALAPFTMIKANILNFSTMSKASKEAKIDLIKIEKDKSRETISVEAELFFKEDNWNLSLSQLNNQKNEYTLSKPSQELGSLVEIFRGPAVNKSSDKDDPLLKFVLNKHIENGEVDLNLVERQNISSSRPLDRYYLNEGDILIICRGHSVQSAILRNVKNEVALATQNIAVLRPKNKNVNTDFIQAFLQSPLGQSELLARQTGSSMIMLSVKDLSSIKIPSIEMDEQDRIANKLKSAKKLRDTSLEKINEEYRKSESLCYMQMGIEDKIKENIKNQRG